MGTYYIVVYQRDGDLQIARDLIAVRYFTTEGLADRFAINNYDNYAIYEWPLESIV